MSIARSRPVLLALAAAALVVGAMVALTSTAAGTPGHLPAGLAVPTTGGPFAIRGTAGADSKGSARSTTVRSTTWAGYVATGNKFRFVRATFRIPKLNCRKTPGTSKLPAMFADWSGLDGFNESHVTVEQDGVYGQCLRGVPTYGAWWETYPKAPFYPDMVVHAGDVIKTSVFYSPRRHEYQLILTDATDREGFSVWRHCGSSRCENATAEVITEQPAAGTATSRHYPLAAFGTSTFDHISITDAAGQRGGYGSALWQNLRVFMVDSRNHMMVSTGGLSSGNTAFRTRWTRAS